MVGSDEPRDGDLRVWWIPQVPMKPFHVPVKTPDEAQLILRTLADYDEYQFENRIKPDYCNLGGLETFEAEEWVDWEESDEIARDANLAIKGVETNGKR